MKKFLIPTSAQQPKQRLKYGILSHNFTLKNYSIALDGLAKAADSSVLVVGCVRDIDNEIISFNVNKLSNTLRSFKDYHIYIYENDSSPSFKDHLKSLKSDKITIESENLRLPKLGGGRDYNRVYCMSLCRNKYVSFFNANPNYDYVIIFDFDLYDFRPDGIFHTLGLQHWNMVGANGLQNVDGKLVYYDIFALVESDYKTYKDGEGRHTPDLHSNLRGVFSCFGGIGIYTREAFVAGDKYYVPIIYGDIHSEHCSFAVNMHKNGCNNIFTNPCMVVIR